MRLRLNVSIGLSSGSPRPNTSLTELIRERFEERRQKMRLAHDASRSVVPTIVVWRYASPMEEYDDRWVPHRVLRQTAESVLVEANPCALEGSNSGRLSNGRVRTYWIDRTELERVGFTKVRSRKTVFFATPHTSIEVVLTIESLMRLGLWWPYSEEDVKQTYRRRALQVHPDAGGSESRFVQLQDDHDRALRALSQDWWRELSA